MRDELDDFKEYFMEIDHEMKEIKAPIIINKDDEEISSLNENINKMSKEIKLLKSNINLLQTENNNVNSINVDKDSEIISLKKINSEKDN